jgi:hypothetical protein
MSNLLTVMTAQADATRRERELLRDLEVQRRTPPASSARPALRSRLAALVLRHRRAVPAS